MSFSSWEEFTDEIGSDTLFKSLDADDDLIADGAHIDDIGMNNVPVAQIMMRIVIAHEVGSPQGLPAKMRRPA